MELNGETFSPSMQKKSPSSLTPQIYASPGGPEAPLANVGSAAEGQLQTTNFGNAREFPVDVSVPLAAHQPISADQNTNFGNATEISADESAPRAAHQPVFADQNADFGNAMEISADESVSHAAHQPVSAGQNANFGNTMEISAVESALPASCQLVSADQNANFGNSVESSVDQLVPADNFNVGLPEWSYATGSLVIHPKSPRVSTMNELTVPYSPISTFTPEGNPEMEDFQPTMADDPLDFLLDPDDGTSFQIRLWNDGNQNHQRR